MREPLDRKVAEETAKKFPPSEILEKLIKSQEDFAFVRNLNLQLLNRIRNSTSISVDVYDYLLSQILKYINAESGLLVLFRGDNYYLKSSINVDKHLTNNELKKELGSHLIEQAIKSNSIVVVDGLKSSSKFQDCNLNFDNILAFTTSSDSHSRTDVDGYLIVIGNKEGGFGTNDVQKSEFVLEIAGEQVAFAEMKNNELSLQLEEIKSLKKDLHETEKELSSKQEEISRTQDQLSKMQKALRKVMWRLGPRIVLAITVAAVLASACIVFLHVVAANFSVYATFFTIVFAMILIAMGLLTSMEIGPAKAKKSNWYS